MAAFFCCEWGVCVAQLASTLAPGVDAVSRAVAILGASSLVGPRVMAGLQESGAALLAVTRQASRQGERDGVRWCALADLTQCIDGWVCLVPVWSLPDFFSTMQRCGAKRVIALSSTSVLTKQGARSVADRETAARIAGGERQLAE